MRAHRTLREDDAVEVNSRLTALAGVLLLVLLAAEMVTVLNVRRLLPAHVFIGFVLLPPVVLKLAGVGWRFARYYLRDLRYRVAGPPRPLMRALAPILVLATIVLLGTGVELWLFGARFGRGWLVAHKLSFLVWFFATAVHVLNYLERAPRLTVAELRPGAPHGVVQRRSLVLASLLLGLVLALAMLPWASPFSPGAGD